MRIVFNFDDDDTGLWVEAFESPPRVGDTVSFGGDWYVVSEVRWVLDAAHPGMGENYVAVFADRKQEETASSR